MPTRPAARRRPALAAALFAAAGAGMAARAQEKTSAAVIMPDGFAIQGRWFKEQEMIPGGHAGTVRVAKGNGFDIVEDGPKFVVFSTHAQRGGKVDPELARADLTTYGRKANLGTAPLPEVADVTHLPPFNDRWWRQIRVAVAGGGFQRIQQQVTALNPYAMMVASPDFAWYCGYHTAEQDPKDVRALLATHPDLKDPDGRPNPTRRLTIAGFLKDVGWLKEARDELARLKADAPGTWDKEVSDRFAQVSEEVDRAETRLTLDALEAAVGSGRYEAARAFLAGFTPKAADAKEVTRLAELKAKIETVQPTYEDTARLLAALIVREGGTAPAEAFAAAAGGPGYLYGPRTRPSTETATLVQAARAVLAELHPDSAQRVELFTALARQADQRAKDGKDPGAKPAELLALAVTGWLKGKNGAETSVAAAARCWATREVALACLRTPTGTDRRALLAAYQRAGQPAAPDELAQVITLLPPAFPAGPDDPGRPVPPADALGVAGIVERETPAGPNAPGGKYLLRLPPEYHHGRAYPLVIALTSHQIPPAHMVARLAPWADRFGYVVAAPVWANQFAARGYDFSGADHPAVTGCLRDLLRRYQVDPDKVFAYGYDQGANFALDVGMAHPDLFAGVVGVGPNPPPAIFREYWRNAQKLPVYFVTGELTGAFPNLRVLFEKWMPAGFPALLTVYKGRSLEWFPMELPRIFDWMGRKARVRGAGSLRLNNAGFEPWQVVREADDRFYWAGVGDGGLREPNLIAGWHKGNRVAPAQFRADIGREGVIQITAPRGIRKFVVWLERDLVDWSKPVDIRVGGATPVGYKKRKLDPDLNLMFDELYRTGDKKMLFLGKIEFKGPG